MNGILISIKYQYSTIQLNKLKIEWVRKLNGVEITNIYGNSLEDFE